MLGAITKEQRIAARVTGFMYLFLGALAAFAEFYIRSGILVDGDAAQTAHNIIASESLFRIGIAGDLLGGACNAILAVTFYVILKNVNSSLALLAAFWRLGEAVILAQGDEFSIGLAYYALGSTVFCYLLLKSRYVPRLLAWWGLLASFIALISTFAIIIFPGAAGIAPGCYAPVGIFEIVTGAWLLIAGISTPRSTPESL